MGGCQNYGPLLGPYYKYGTYYLGYPKRGLHFDSYPYVGMFAPAALTSLSLRAIDHGLGVERLGHLNLKLQKITMLNPNFGT